MNKQFLETHKQDPGSNQFQVDNFERVIHVDLHEMNTSEGAEFLDDIIRLDDESLRDTGIPEDEISLYIPEPFNEPGDE